MLYTDIPTHIPEPFGKNAGGSYIHPIPKASQIGVTAGAASYNDGFPPLAFTPRGSGGAGPFGNDVNGILNATSSWDWWLGSGGPVFFNSAHATDIGGYPKYAMLFSTTLGILWQSQVDNNTVDPDAGPSANWAPMTQPTGDVSSGESFTLASGKIIKDGEYISTVYVANTYTVTFATPFPTACRKVGMTGINYSASAARDNWPQLYSKNRFGFTTIIQGTVTGGDNTLDGFEWDASGY